MAGSLTRAADGAVVTMTRAMTKAMGQPYPGSRPFESTDSDRFFGRKHEAAAIAERWRTNSLTMLVGSTGIGKTSLIQAGLLPLLAGGRAEVLSPGRVSHAATFPAAALPEHNPYTVALLGSWSPGESSTRLVGLTVSGFVRQRAAAHSGVILAVIDQSEEVLADCGPRKTYRRRFLRELATALREEPRLHLLLGVRESALEELTHELGHGAQYRIGALSFDSAVDAVAQPARCVGVEFGSGAAEHLVLEVQGGLTGVPSADEWQDTGADVQPALLQVACTRLWDTLPAQLDCITERHVRTYGDVDLALSTYCGQLIASVADENGIPAARLRSWLIRTFVNDRGHRGTAYEGMTDTAGLPSTLARILEDRHLLTSTRRSRTRWYELLSECLIGPLQQAVDERPAPAGPRDYLRIAARALAMGEPDLAERYARHVLRTARPDDLRLQADVQSLLGNLAHERGKPGEAEASYRRAAELFETARDKSAVARQLAAVGQTLLAQDRPAEAVAELRAAVDRLPQDLILQTELGWALWQFGQARAAEAIFTGVLAVDGGNLEALRGRGEILADRGEARSALRDLDRLAVAGLPTVRAARALALTQLGEQAEAGEEIKSALGDAPRHGPVLLYAARIEALGGDQSASAELAERAVTATDPPLPPHQREAAQRLADRS